MPQGGESIKSTCLRIPAATSSSQCYMKRITWHNNHDEGGDTHIYIDR